MNKINYTEQILDRQKELLTLLDWSVTLMYERFKSSGIYSKLQYLEEHGKDRNVKTFITKEQEALEQAIKTCFAPFIENLKRYCPRLTYRERLICCLAIRFSALTISLSFGYSNTNCVKTSKNRIKRKMVQLSDFGFLFYHIFHKEADNHN
ncbi:MAG: hypothetical protein LBR17_06745 [Bacteroidales bacterium]|jgi:hypothetical protein|nr:hypothetical protein [Bacteroidales bacterium]